MKSNTHFSKHNSALLKTKGRVFTRWNAVTEQQASRLMRARPPCLLRGDPEAEHAATERYCPRSELVGNAGF